MTESGGGAPFRRSSAVGRVSRRPDLSSYQPASCPDLSVVRRRQPCAETELSPEERVQLHAAMFDGEPGGSLDDVLVDEEYGVEVAEVVDADGAVRFRLYGWNHGVGFLFPPAGFDVVACGFQHDIEHWRVEQRDVFAAMDLAMSKAGHGFRQPLFFCWGDDSCWDRIRDRRPGTVQSEPWVRAAMARAEGAGGRRG